MRYDSENHHRRSIRLEGYDYSRAGAYFITICTNNRACLFGEIIGDEMMLNDAGHMLAMVWNALPTRFDHLELDGFVVMPNHIHAIIVLSGRHPRRGEPRVLPNDRVRPNGGVDNGNQGEYKIRPYGNTIHDHPNAINNHPNGGNGNHDHPNGTLPDTLGRIIQAFKSISTNAYIHGVKQSGWPPFPGIVWQRNYWEHIVRDEPDLNRLREYIHHNPAKWALDELMVVH